MKRLFLSLAILIGVSLTMSVDAQNIKREGRPGQRMEKELNLTADQKQKMETLRTDFGTKMKELRDNSTLSKDDKKTKMKELRDNHMVEVNKILTPEQQTKMKEWKDKRGEIAKKQDEKKGKNIRNKANMPKRGKMAKGADRMKDLNLTDDQKQKIKALNDDFRIKSGELSKQHREEMNKVYTPEQRTKLDEMRKNFNKENRFSYKGKRGDYKLDEASKTKLKDLKENYLKEKKAVELSRIAPDAQKQKIKELTIKYRDNKRQIIKDARKVNENKPV